MQYSRLILATLLSFIGLLSFAQRQTVFEDNFVSHVGRWGEFENDQASALIEETEGQYHLRHKAQAKSYTFATGSEINETNNYYLEVEFAFGEVGKNAAFGLIVGMSSSENFYTVEVDVDGRIRIFGFKENAPFVIKDWFDAGVELKENNFIGLLREKDQWVVYVNDEPVYGTHYRRFFGNQLGFILHGEVEAFVKHIVAFESAFKLTPPHGKTVTEGLEMLMYEHFDNNKALWPEVNSDSALAKVSRGQYKLGHYVEDGFSKYTHYVPIDQHGDFFVRSRIAQTSGMTNAGCGLMWGAKDDKNYYSFTVSAEGFFRIGGKHMGEVFDIVGRTISDHINGLEEANDLAMQKQGDMIHFYINDELVHSTFHNKFFGPRLGFILYNKMTAEVDYIETYTPPTEINLVQGASETSERIQIGENVNSKYEELAPVVSQDEKMLWFLRNHHPQSIGTKGNNDIWESKIKGGEWQEAVILGEPLNDANPNFVVSVTPDNNSLVLGNVYEEDGTSAPGVSISHRTARGWSQPEEMHVRDFYNESEIVNYSMSSDNKHLLMALTREDTYGEEDLYVSRHIRDNEWAVPINLGEVVNSFGSELTPFLCSDNKTLFFSSDGHAGYGYHDLFMTKRLDDSWTLWSEPLNLGKGVNTSDWDGYYTVPAVGDHAYMVTYENTLGEADIFKVPLHPAARPEAVELVKGRVLNATTQEPIATSITIHDLETDKEVGIAHSSPVDGSYEIVLPKGSLYSFYAESEGFYSVRENVDLVLLKSYEEVKKDLFLSPLKVGESIRLNNVFFVRGLPEMIEYSYAELDNLVTIMQDNATLEIMIEGHTDYTGNASMNQTLSEERAQNVMDYLAKKGIKKSRLSWKGYGGTNPVAKNDSEANRRLNRRVEFKVIAF